MSNENMPMITKRIFSDDLIKSPNGINLLNINNAETPILKRTKRNEIIKNNFVTPNARPRSIIKISSEIKDHGLSPISEIVFNLSDTSIGTPPQKSGIDIINGNEKPTLKSTPLRSHICKGNKEPRLLLDDIEDDIYIKSDGEITSSEKSLISNNFTLNSGGRSLAVRRQESRSRIRPNIEPLVLNYDEEFQASSPEKSNIMAVDDVSFYDNHSPRGGSSPRQYPSSPMINVGLLSPEGSPQRFTVVQNTVTMVDKRRSIDEIDGSSVDSGYGTTSFKFAEPQLLPIKKLEPSPRKNSNDIQLQNLLCNRDNKTPPKSFRLFHSLSSGSMESMDDEYMELFEMENLEDDSHLPSDLNSLISGHIKAVKTTPDIKRPSVRRCLSLTENNSRNQARSALFEPKTPEILKPVQDNNNTPTTITTSTTPFSSRHIERCFKRPEPPSISPIQSKRYKTDTDEKENNILRNEKINFTTQIITRPPLRKSMSMNDAHIMTALARSSSEPDLIGDFSKPFCLPLMPGRHRDLKSISSSTMAKLILGEYRNNVASFKIIDCRYPYEYEGGHIRGAQNLYTHEQILDELVNTKTESQIVQADGPKRHILVFHCEFSSERGPKLSRFLRSHDRLCNSNKYPALHYPEIYLLHGGYKEFFENYSDLCDPISYRPMLDPSFGAAYKQFRAKSKSWNGDIKASGTTNRLSKSRSRLVL